MIGHCWVERKVVCGHLLFSCLPFGLWSMLKIFTALADMLEWCVKEQGASYHFHYLDDYIMMGSAEL